MKPDELVRRMRAALAEEREGIRTFDTFAIRRANDAKATVLSSLRQATNSERPALYEALDELKAELRCNLLLLTQVRAFLREGRS